MGRKGRLLFSILPFLLHAQTVYNVKRYRAAGDGATNDTSAVQSAINAARAAGSGTVYFPASGGCYMVSGLTFYSNITYTGEGQDVCIKMTSPNMSVVTTPATAPFSNATISYLTFNGNAGGFNGNDCLNLRGPTNVRIDHVTTTNCGEDEIGRAHV
jgi:polygalacturonase